MAAINPNALAKFVGEAYVRVNGGSTYTRMASVRGLTSTLSFEKTDINADDTGTVFTVSEPNATVTFSWLENFIIDTLDIIIPGTKTNNAGTPVAVTDEEILALSAVTWGTGETLWFDNKNGANTAVASITVTHNSGSLVLGTDYVVTLGDDGRTGVTNITTDLTLVTAVTADYTYTPSSYDKFTLTREQVVLPQLDFKILATDDSGNERTIILTDCTISGDLAFEFLNVVEAGDINGTSLTFELNKGGTWEFQDGINI